MTKAGLALREIAVEAARASEMFAPFNSAHEGFAVLMEEVDELWDEVKRNPQKAPDAIPGDPGRNVRVHNERMRAEAIQVGAMAVRFLTDLKEGN